MAKIFPINGPHIRHRLSSSFDETDFVVLDVETTGLSAHEGDRVCEIGVVKLRGSAIVDSFGSLINPQRPISAGAFAVNRISQEMIEHAPTFEEISQRLSSIIDGNVIVAYNAGFDISFLEHEYRLIGKDLNNHGVLDALAIARQLLPGLGKYPQGNVARALGIPFPIQHRALEDAMVTAQIFSIFLSTLKAYGCTNIEDVKRGDLKQRLQDRRMGLITQALSSGEKLWLRYLSTTDGSVSQRIVSPIDCVMDRFKRNGATYLVAFCHQAQAEKNFRIDRMLDIRVVNNAVL